MKFYFCLQTIQLAYIFKEWIEAESSKRQINQKVYELYELTPEEIKIVEESEA